MVAPLGATSAPPGQVRGGPITSSDTVYLSVAWGTLTEAQVRNFLRVQNGTNTVRDAQGALVASTSRATGNTDYWTLPYKVSNAAEARPRCGSRDCTSRRAAPGRQLRHRGGPCRITKPSFDGFDTYPAGSWFTLTSCGMTVSERDGAVRGGLQRAVLPARVGCRSF